MSKFELTNILPEEVSQLVNEDYKIKGLILVLNELLGACRTIGTVMREGGYSSNQVGTTNVFGDNQLGLLNCIIFLVFTKLFSLSNNSIDVDVKTDAVIFSGIFNYFDFTETYLIHNIFQH